MLLGLSEAAVLAEVGREGAGAVVAEEGRVGMDEPAEDGRDLADIGRKMCGAPGAGGTSAGPAGAHRQHRLPAASSAGWGRAATGRTRAWCARAPRGDGRRTPKCGRGCGR
mmetsp:Transcript_35983/g.111804  ORF Transcript_35983/g.111804 Transcript_35983/m.111804 type:complete len:111 (-) Transcript_35983:1325-1657(-)